MKERGGRSHRAQGPSNRDGAEEEALQEGTKGAKRSQEDGEDASLTRGSIHPALRWGRADEHSDPCLPTEEVGGQARAWSKGLSKGVSSSI